MSSSNTPRERLTRRQLLGSGAAASAAALAGCSGGGGGGPAVQTQKRVQWRLASSFPSSLDTIYGSAEVLAERLEAMSGGRFKVRVYQGGELVPANSVLDAVQAGSVHVGQTAGYYYTGKSDALALDTCVPFGLTARQQSAWLLEGGGMELLRGLYADFGVVNFVSGNTGVQMGGWFKRPIAGPEDLRGLKMRIPGLGGKVMSELGVAVQLLASGEIYQALERGAIDATEWVGPYDDEKLGFHKVAKHYIYPGWWEPGPSLSFLVNRSAWDELPAEYQAMFQAAAAEAASAMQTRYDAKNPPALARLRQADIAIEPFPDGVMQAASDASAQLLSDLAAKDATFRRIHEHWQKFRADSFRWFQTAELAYQGFAFSRV